MLSCDEWHNRFLLSLLPFLIILATIGLGEKYAPVLPHKILESLADRFIFQSLSNRFVHQPLCIGFGYGI
jgi:hypothetical protein